MSDHLPECPLATACKHDYYDEPPVQCANCGEECLCPALRACEQRVRDELFPLRWGRAEQLEEARVNGWHSGWNAAIEDGHAAGVQAARDAVEALPTSVTYMGDFAIVKHVDKEVALAVIDALKEKP